MFKRLATLIFILAVTGQAFGGVCDCFAKESKRHSCCKPSKVIRDAIGAKGCCETECLKRVNENSPQTRTEAVAKITLKSRPATTVVQIWTFEPIAGYCQPTISPYVNHRLKYSRPPELYLRHQAFLI